MLSWFPKLHLKDERKKKEHKETSTIDWKEHVEFIPGNPRLIRSRNFRRHLRQIKCLESLPRMSDNDSVQQRLDRLPSKSEPSSPRRISNESDVPIYNGTRKSYDDFTRPRKSGGASVDYFKTSGINSSPGNDLQDNGSNSSGSSFRENQCPAFISQSQRTPMEMLNVVMPWESDSCTHQENHVTGGEKNGKVGCGSAQVTARTQAFKPANTGLSHQLVGVRSNMPTSSIANSNVSYSSYNDTGRYRPRTDHEWIRERTVPEGFHRASFETPTSHLSSPNVASPHKIPLGSSRRTPVSSPRLESPQKTPIQSPRRSPLSSPRLESPRKTPIQSPRRSPLSSPRIESPHKTPIQSPRRSPLSSPRLETPHKTPTQSPRRSSLSSPNRNNNVSPDHTVPQHVHAHPLPLPPDWQICPRSAPRSPTSIAPSPMNQSKFDDSGRFDSPSPWPRSPGKSETSSGKWLKGSHLGSGSFGKVYKGIHRETGDLCAIKEVELVGDDPKSQESAKQLSQEITFLSALRHPNILHYKGSEMVGNSLYIYLELVSGGSIYKLLREFEGKFPEPVVRRYTRQILLGLEYLHSKNTVHRDVKCANVLVDQDGVVKLADFGMAKLVGEQIAPLSFKGSPYWIAPEVILQNSAGHELAVDIWSLGCTVIEMATGNPPWSQYEGCAAMFKVMNSRDVPIPDTLSPIGQDFVRLCLQRDPAKRPSASQLLCHPYMQLDSPMTSNGATLSQAVVERITLRDRADFGAHQDRAMLHSPAVSVSTDITPRYDRMAMSGPVSPQRYFQVPLHTSHSDMNLLTQNQSHYNHGGARLINEYVNHYGKESSRSRLSFSSRKFSGEYGPRLPYHEWDTTRR